MGSTTLTIQAPALLGTVVAGVTAVASSETCTIKASSAASVVDFSSLVVRITAVGGSVTPTILFGSVWSSIGQGSKALTTIASSTSAIVGGQDFEGARFQNASGNCVFSFAGSGTASIEAYQKPWANE